MPSGLRVLGVTSMMLLAMPITLPAALIGDQQPGAVRKYTFTSMPFYKAGSPLLPSGLLGPVELQQVTRH